MAQPRSIFDLIREKFGGNARFVEGGVTSTVGVASALILRDNPQRVAALIVNHSANQVNVRSRSEATLTSGVRLNANGGTLILNWEDDLILPALDWFAIAGGAGSAIYIGEVILESGGSEEA